MATRRDWQLQQLGFTRWQLRRPAVLQGEIAVSLPANVRLLIISGAALAPDEPLIQDVLRALRINSDDVLPLTPDRVAMLPEGSHCNSWWLGEPAQATLPGVQLCSPPLAQLQQDGAARATLWQQICEHEHDFFPFDR